jgi:voltage-gated potassium channel
MFSTRAELMAAVSAIAASLLIGTVAYQFLEGWSPVQSFYFSVTTLTTVGYGDLHPTNEVSMLFTAFYIITNVAVVLAALSIIGTHYIKHREKDLLDGMNRVKSDMEAGTRLDKAEMSIMDELRGRVRQNMSRKAGKK